MGAIEENLWKSLTDRLQGTPLRGHGLLQSEYFSRPNGIHPLQAHFLNLNNPIKKGRTREGSTFFSTRQRESADTARSVSAYRGLRAV